MHHKDVAGLIKERIEHKISGAEESNSNIKVLSLSADLSSEQRNNIVLQFQNDSNARVLIASKLASGEGLNLQFCHDCIMLERQWNPANEEQAEARFIRYGQESDKVTGTYFIAVGTVDEFFSELVEKKREIMTSVLDGNEVKWDETELIKNLAEIVRQKGGARWSL